MKSWDLQSGTFIRSFGARIRTVEELEGRVQTKELNVHKGPVKVVYIHDNMNSLAFSGSANELLVWNLEEGTLKQVMVDHTRPVSAICCYQHIDDHKNYENSDNDDVKDEDDDPDHPPVDRAKHPASVVSGGEDSLVFVYCLRDFTLRYKLDNQAGPVHDITILAVNLNDNSNKERLPVIMVACFDGSVQLWSLSSGQWLSSMQLQHGPVTAICVLPTPVPGLVTGHGDGMIFLTNLKTQDVLCALSKKSAQIQTQTPSHTQTQASAWRGPAVTGALKATENFGLPIPVTTLSCVMSPRPMVLGGFQSQHVYVWDLNIGKTAEAALLMNILVVELRWKDPLLAHHSDSEDEEGEKKIEVPAARVSDGEMKKGAREDAAHNGKDKKALIKKRVTRSKRVKKSRDSTPI